MLIKRYYRQQRARLSVAPLALRPEVSRKRRLLRGGLLFFLAAVLLGGGGWMGWNHGGEVLQRSLDRQSRRIVQLEDQVASEMAARRLAEQQLTVERATRETLARELTLPEEFENGIFLCEGDQPDTAVFWRNATDSSLELMLGNLLTGEVLSRRMIEYPGEYSIAFLEKRGGRIIAAKRTIRCRNRVLWTES